MSDEAENGQQTSDRVIEEVCRIYEPSGNVYTSRGNNGALLIRTFMAVMILTVVDRSPEGYSLRTLFGIGSEVGRAQIAEVLNEINSGLREGAFYQDGDGDIIFRMHIHDNGSITGMDIVRAVKLGIITFLENKDDIIECIMDLDGLQTDDFVVLEEVDG